jgi:hypothetical protein
MDAISVTPLGVDFLEFGELLCLHCVDFQFPLTCTVKSLPFMSLNLVGGHVSFTDNHRERRIVMFPDCQKLRELSEESSPLTIRVLTCCELEVSSGYLLTIYIYSQLIE